MVVTDGLILKILFIADFSSLRIVVCQTYYFLRMEYHLPVFAALFIDKVLIGNVVTLFLIQRTSSKLPFFRLFFRYENIARILSVLLADACHFGVKTVEMVIDARELLCHVIHLDFDSCSRVIKVVERVECCNLRFEMWIAILHDTENVFSKKLFTNLKSRQNERN